MVQLKIVLDTRRAKSDGTYPVVYRVTQVKKVVYYPTGISLIEEDWIKTTRTVKKKQRTAQFRKTG